MREIRASEVLDSRELWKTVRLQEAEIARLRAENEVLIVDNKKLVAAAGAEATLAEQMREALDEAKAELQDRDHAIRWLVKGVDFERTMPNETRPTIRAALTNPQ